MRIMFWNIKNNFDGGATQRNAVEAVIARLEPDIFVAAESLPADNADWDTLATNLSMTALKMGIEGTENNHQFVWLTASGITVNDSGHLGEAGLSSGDASHFQRMPAWIRATYDTTKEVIITTVHNSSIAEYLTGDVGSYLRGLELHKTLETLLSYRKHYEATSGVLPGFVVIGDFNHGPNSAPTFPQPNDFASKPSGTYPSGYSDPNRAYPVTYGSSGAYPGTVLTRFGLTLENPTRTDTLDETTYDESQSVAITEDLRLDGVATSDNVTVLGSEIYASATDADPAVGLAKPGTLPAAGDVLAGSDHLPPVVDIA